MKILTLIQLKSMEYEKKVGGEGRCIFKNVSLSEQLP